MLSSRGSSQPTNSRLLCLLHWQVGSLPLAPSDAKIFTVTFFIIKEKGITNRNPAAER